MVVQSKATSLRGRVSRADTAAVCVAALTSPSAKNVTFELSSKSGTPTHKEHLHTLFENLKAD